MNLPKKERQDWWGTKFIRFGTVELKTYPVENRLFNVILALQDYQRDGVILASVILFNRGYKVEWWFSSNNKFKEFDFRLFRRK